MKKAVARPLKNSKLKEQKKTLIEMHDEMVLLVEQFRQTTIIQAKQIELLKGRGFFGRLLNVLLPPSQLELNETSVKMLQEFKAMKEAVSEDSPS